MTHFQNPKLEFFKKKVILWHISRTLSRNFSKKKSYSDRKNPVMPLPVNGTSGTFQIWLISRTLSRNFSGTNGYTEPMVPETGNRRNRGRLRFPEKKIFGYGYGYGSREKNLRLRLRFPEKFFSVTVTVTVPEKKNYGYGYGSWKWEVTVPGTVPGTVPKITRLARWYIWGCLQL